ncbi:MAG TPA: biotin transporter BioY [Bacillota bacterium]|jgi:biotin transport system substrate-specific component|nr:biotin transporter BioY [Fastidiosipila sp.]HPX93238.1 biotin transporter BioY [Bacillota bacterium]HQB81062.1 biotin transporter BioY [Bacillota bacterium]
MTSRALTRISLMAVVTFAAGLIRLPAGPLPVTLQTLAVLLAGLLLTPAQAFYAMCLHLILKLLLGGTGLFLAPSFGFVLAFIPSAALLAWLTKRRGPGTAAGLIHVTAASLLLYLIGLPYLAVILHVAGGMNSIDPVWLLKTGMLVFLPGDLIKAGLALLMAGRIRPLLET